MKYKINTKNVFATLSVVYLAIEVQAFTFLSKLYRTDVSSALLSDYERFGYASAGIGISLFFAQWAWTRAKNTKSKFGVLLCLPLLYIITVWSSYEIVHKSPDWISEKERPKAMANAVQTLSSPSWSNLASFYLDGDITVSDLDVKKLISKHPASDRVVQASFINGMRNLDRFNDMYSKNAPTLDRSVWRSLWKEAVNKTYFDKNAPDEEDAEYQYMAAVAFLNRAQDDPTKWADLLPTLMYISITDPGLAHLLSFEMEGFTSGEKMGIAEIDKAGLANVRTEAYVWKRFQERYFNFPGYIAGSSPIEERMRVAFSEMIMGDFTYLPGESIPWHRDGVSPSEHAIYKKALHQIAPYIVYKDGTSLIRLSSIFDDTTREMYSGKLRMGVPGSIRKAWSDYEENAISTLAVNAEEWKVPSQYKLHSDYLRIGAILPFMMLFSFMLIVLNTVKIFKGGLAYGFAAVSVATLVFIEASPVFQNSLLKALVLISVKESQIFIH